MDAATDITASHMLPARLPKGFELEGYVVDGWLRDGGMAAIYRARRASDDRRVALKLQLPSTAHDPAIGARFDLEAELMRRTGDGAHVVELLDGGVLDDGRRWLVMEWVEGEDLEELLDFTRNQDQRLSLARACRLGRDVARGLAELHGHGVVHLDLKPANVMVGRRDDGGDLIKLVDFGIAADLRAGPKASGPSAGNKGVMGTSAYMPPEQVAGAPCNPSFDLYAWGVLMFEALSGSCLPPDGWSPETLPKLETLRRGVPADLAGLVRACMDAEPRRRPESADAVVRALVVIIRQLESSGGKQAASSDDIPVRTGGTQVVLRSGMVAAATVVRESGAVPAGTAAVRESGVMAAAAVRESGVMAAAVRESGVMTAAVVRESGAVPARTGQTEIVQALGLKAALREREEPARTGGTEVVLTHQEVLQSSGIAPVLTTEMVADAMDRLAAQEEAEKQEQQGKARGQWRTIAAVAAAVVLVVGGGAWVVLGGSSEPQPAKAGEVGAMAGASHRPAEESAPAPEGARAARSETPELVAAEVEEVVDDVASEEDGEQGSEVGEGDDEAASEDAPDAADSTVLAPSSGGKAARKAAPSKEECAEMRVAALSAKSMRAWEKVLRATGKRGCWGSSELRLERTRLRVEAYAEQGMFDKCAKEGGKSRDREVSARVGFCRKRSGG